MNGFSIVTFSGLHPRRLFVRLEQVESQNDDALRRSIEEGQVAVCWLHKVASEDGQTTDEKWECADVGVNGSIPPHVWQDSLRLRSPTGDPPDEGQPQEIGDARYLDIDLVVARNGQCGLRITWNPRSVTANPQPGAALPEAGALLITREQEVQRPAESSQHWLLTLHVPCIELVPRKSRCAGSRGRFAGIVRFLP